MNLQVKSESKSFIFKIYIKIKINFKSQILNSIKINLSKNRSDFTVK